MATTVLDLSVAQDIEYNGASISVLELSREDNSSVPAETNVSVTIESWGGVDVVVMDGSRRAPLNILLGHTYVFDQSDASNSGHELHFYTSAGARYTTGITSTGTPGTAGASTRFEVPLDAPLGLEYRSSQQTSTLDHEKSGNFIYRFNRKLQTARYELWRKVYVVQSEIQNVQVYIEPTYGQETYVIATTSGGSGSWYVNCDPNPGYMWTGSCGNSSPASCSCPSGYSGSCSWSNVGGCPWGCSVRCEKTGTRTVQTGGGYYETQSTEVDTSFWKYFY